MYWKFTVLALSNSAACDSFTNHLYDSTGVHNDNKLLIPHSLRTSTRTTPTSLTTCNPQTHCEIFFASCCFSRSPWWHIITPLNALGDASLRQRSQYYSISYFRSCASHYANIQTIPQRWIWCFLTNHLCHTLRAKWFLHHGAKVPLHWVPHISALSNFYIPSRRITPIF